MPKKFVMWLIVFASFMIFAALTSGFIVYVGGKGKGLSITIPPIFLYSTITIALSSLSMFLASKAAKQLKFTMQRLFLWITIGLGIAFFVLQVNGWSQLVDMGVYFVNPNASQSFIYVFTGMHLLHIVAGLLLLLNSLVGSYRNIPQVKRIFWMEMSAIFWHFVDIIWIYLYVFLLLNQK
ncbi:cytochrome c oxidase subunit 3 [Mucilaginibacter sp. UR6-1]|uniref:cytochrome c oxidase subunit 3 n=1 Tax=Mucilaginibacter sp. UR6-1 TaxID=1435643 RepID=UPI001E3235BF|nr:cytochrome c oxidase subunit 3 [Mucilaginibacter sp. UR6-1]MCC8410850.1 cytochrome c oxidase subunit 3 [Mucilaginibacter sp. UR6-1]